MAKLQADDIVLIKVTTLEAHMIKVIRTIAYGEVTIKKVAGVPVKVDPKDSVLLKPDGASDLIVTEQ